MTAPLDGLRVLDLTRGMSGAVATMLLADYGAEVVSVVASRDPTLRTWDRGKRRLVAPPTDPQVRRLAASADVVIAAADCMAAGLDAASVRTANPDVVYVAFTGFGMHDRRATPAIEALVGAELGTMITVPAARRDGPVFNGHPAVAYSTAFVMTAGVLAALRARVLAGTGDVLDVSILDGVLAQFTMNWWTAKRVSFLTSRRADGQLDLGRTRMIVRRFLCADDRRIQVHTGAAGGFGRLMKVLGVDDRISPVTTAVENASLLTDDDLAVLETLPELFRTRAADDWLADLWANEVAALPVQQPGVVFADDQVQHNGLIRSIDDPELGAIEVVAPPIQMSRTPAVVSQPCADEHVVDWRAPGLGPGGAAELVKGPLDGVNVVELATFFASPYANRFLRDLGADVVKIEPLSGDPMRSLPDPFEGVSRGKLSLAVDLKSPEVRPAIETLLRRADVVQHNFRPGAAERLRVDYDSVRALNPEIIYGYAPGFGSSGPKSMLQSFAPLQSGFVGIAAEGSGQGNEPTGTFGNEDYYNGQLNAIGLLLALVHKARTGQGQYVECAQVSSGVFVTSHWYRRHGELHSTLPSLDGDQFGFSPFQRIYQCLEGWLCVYCTNDEQRAAQASCAGKSDDDFFARTAAEWVEVLRPAGVPCTVVREDYWVYEFLREPAAVAAGRATPYEHHEHGSVSAIGRIIQLANYLPNEPVRSPRLGEHSREVLTATGLTDADIDALVEKGVVRA